MRKIWTLLLLPCLVLCGCGEAAPKEKEGLQIVTSIFPVYDFARAVAGEGAEVTMLLPPGADSHSYEPSPKEMAALYESDLFLYTGSQMELWAKTLTAELPDTIAVCSLSEGLELSHDHEGHDHGVDPHLWTDPVLAQQLLQKITGSLCAVDEENAEAYRQRAEEYYGELTALHEELMSLREQAVRDTLYFGGRFAFSYLCERYELTAVSAYDSCSAEAEPSAAVIARMTDEMKKKKIPVIYYEELSEPKIANFLAEETGAEPLLLHSAHNLSREEFEAGITYMDIMRENIENLRKGLCQ